mgnify:FL=1
MYTALKKHVVAYVIFKGLDEYPKWFTNEVMPYIAEDEFKYYILMSSGDPSNDRISIYPSEEYKQEFKLTEGYDVFIKNHRGDVLRMNLQTFHKHYTEISDEIAALNRYIMTYCWVSDGNLIPAYINNYDRFSGRTIGDIGLDLCLEIDELSLDVMALIVNDESDIMPLCPDTFYEHLVDENSSVGPDIFGWCS